MRIGHVDLRQLRGVNEKMLGLGKELVGVVVGNDRLQHEGEAQQEKGSATLRALRKEIEAQKDELKVDALEQQQKAAQQAKEAS